MTEEQMRQRREELRRNREQRAMLLKQRRKRRLQQAFLCIFLLGLAACVTIFCIRFPARYRAAQEKQQQEQVKSVAVVETAPPVPVKIETKEPEEQPVIKDTLSEMLGYQAENDTRYRNYQAVTNYSDEETIWRVNARLDLTAYQDIVTVNTNKLNTDPLVVVNKYHKVPEGYEPPDLKPNADGCYLRAQAADAFDRMKRDAATQGLNLRAISGYRSVGYQRDLYNSYLASDSKENVDTYSARAGHSEHHTGLAVDVFGSVDGLGEFVNTPEYSWVLQYAHEYGFIIRYTAQWEAVTGYMDEPWHLRYIGKDYAMDMKARNIATLEEYVGMNSTLE